MHLPNTFLLALSGVSLFSALPITQSPRNELCQFGLTDRTAELSDRREITSLECPSCVFKYTSALDLNGRTEEDSTYNKRGNNEASGRGGYNKRSAQADNRGGHN